jgi:hypothetical protein
MDNGAVADTLMSALTRVQTALAPPPDTAGDAEYAAQVEDDLNMEEWHSTCDAALAAFLAQCDPTEGDAALAASLAPPDTTGDAAFAASLAPQVSSLVDPRALRPRFHSRAIASVRCVRLTPISALRTTSVKSNQQQQKSSASCGGW